MTDLLLPLDASPLLPGYPVQWGHNFRQDEGQFVEYVHRYVLWRVWGGGKRPRYLMVVGLNPSTADETNDDPTIRRCVDFAKRWGFEALCMTNLFAYRATDPRDMKAAQEYGYDPVGWDNDQWLRDCAQGAGKVLAAWGAHGSHLERASRVISMFEAWGIPLEALGTTKDGHPRHPLYIPKIATPGPFPAREEGL